MSASPTPAHQSAALRAARRERLRAELWGLWDSDQPPSDKELDRLLAVRPLDGVTSHEAASIGRSVKELRALGHADLAGYAAALLARYEQAPEQVEGRGVAERRWRPLSLTIQDRGHCEAVAQALEAADYPARYGAQSFRSIANRLWELRGVERRLSPLGSW